MWRRNSIGCLLAKTCSELVAQVLKKYRIVSKPSSFEQASIKDLVHDVKGLDITHRDNFINYYDKLLICYQFPNSAFMSKKFEA